MDFVTGGVTRWRVSTSGHLVAGVDNGYDIGAAANNRPRDLYLGGTATMKQIKIARTDTAAGTTGAQTINKGAGSVNFAAAAASLVITNSLVTTSTRALATVNTNDSTCYAVQAVCGAGSITLYAKPAAPTAEMNVSFLILNP